MHRFSRSTLATLALFAAGCEQATAPVVQEDGAAEVTGSVDADLSVSNCRALVPVSSSASGNDGNVPGNTLDDDLATRWSNLGKGSWLQYDLGSSRRLAGAAVAWHQGNVRSNTFVLSVSTDGTTFTSAFLGTSTGTTTAAETYRFAAVQSARYLRITVNGNSVNDWASIAEARPCEQSLVDEGPALPRAPYLQSVGATQALVAFQTGTSCAPVVRYGVDDATDKSATAPTGWRHAVRLEGLSPGRRHTYVVEACGSRTAPRSFVTAPIPGTPRVRFAALGDFGTGGTAQRDVIASIERQSPQPELMLALGDNAYSSGTEQEFKDRLFTPMASLLRQVPMFASLGNHEYLTNQGQPYLDNFYLPANNPARTERYYSFDWGHVHFVALDSNCVIGLASSDRCTLTAQKSWLEQDLAASRAAWKVVFFHHPPWSSGEHGSQLKMRREFAPLFEKYGVDLVLTGHDHNYERSKPMLGEGLASAGTKGIPYVVVGSGGATLRPFPSSQPSWTAVRNSQAYGYLDVKVEGGTLSARFLAPNGSTVDSFTLTKTITASERTESVRAEALTTPPGPKDDPARKPEGLGETRELPPVDDSDHDEPRQMEHAAEIDAAH